MRGLVGCGQTPYMRQRFNSPHVLTVRKRFRKMLKKATFSPVPSQSPTPFLRVAWPILDCARRTSTFLSCAFREQEDD
jgi:hypothetical protein